MTFKTKQFSQEIMKRSRLHNFLRNRMEENRILINSQINYCVSLLRKSQRGYTTKTEMQKKEVITKCLRKMFT